MAAGLTQEDLAERAGLSVRALGDLERGSTGRPQARSVRRLCAALGLGDRAAQLLVQAAALSSSGAQPGRRQVRPVGVAVTSLTDRTPQGRCELPADVPLLAGRAAEAAALVALLSGRRRAGGRPSVANVVGPAGIGKTALAVHVAHQVRSSYGDGQVYVDLAGGTDPADPWAVLGRVLRSLGLADPPGALEERAALVRAELNDRAVLLVLEGATEDTGVPLLLPASGRSAVLVTSRFPLAAIPRDRCLELEGLTSQAGVALFDHEVGGARVAAEPHAARDVVAFCAGLPVAIRAVGCHLARHPRAPISDLVRQLRDRTRPWDVLEYGTLSTRAALATEHRRLSALEQRALALLAEQTREPFQPADLARLLAISTDEAQRAIEQLLTCRFLDTVTAGGYQLRDLGRTFVGEHLRHGYGRRIERRTGDTAVAGS